MWPCDLAPDDTDLRASDGLLGAVDVCYSLSEVELSIFGAINALNLDERGVWVGIALPPLVGQVLSLNV